MTDSLIDGRVIDGETPEGMAEILLMIASSEGRALTDTELDMLHRHKQAQVEKREAGKSQSQIPLGTGVNKHG